MQDDIVVRKPPGSSDKQTNIPEDEPPAQEEGTASNTQPGQAAGAAISKNNVPVGVIVLAVFICIGLISAAVYGSLGQ